MKKNLLVALLTLALVLCCVPVMAEEAAPTVLVTIVNGTPEAIFVPVTLADIDNDGLYTINDALSLAHDATFEGGAAAGYGSAMSDWGLSLTRLWGVENGGSYGYYVNDAAAMSLADVLADGDMVTAFVYTDTTAWSDTYCFFDAALVEAQLGADVTITLMACGYDENWSPVSVPVAGARLLINGVETELVSDENGCFTFAADVAGDYIISAAHDTMNLVPPVCLLTVAE